MKGTAPKSPKLDHLIIETHGFGDTPIYFKKTSGLLMIFVIDQSHFSNRKGGRDKHSLGTSGGSPAMCHVQSRGLSHPVAT